MKLKFAFRFMWQKDAYYDMLTHGVLLGFFCDYFSLKSTNNDFRKLLNHLNPNQPQKAFYLYLGFIVFYLRLTLEK